MQTPAKLGIFGVGLAAVFGVAVGAGTLAGPVGAVGAASPVGAEAKPHATHGGDRAGASAGGGAEHGGPATGGTLPGGLLVSDRGYTLAKVPADKDEFAFRIIGPNGRAVTAFDLEHDKRMHLIVVRRDLSKFRHVHPTMDVDGTWRVAAPMDGPGTYRAFADFKPTAGDPLVLGVDIEDGGEVTPRPLPAPAATDSVDGYEVALKGALTPGRSSPLHLTISRDGRPVTDLQPYLAAYGHLVALREGDLAYLHVHPDGEPGDGRTRPGPTITFFAEAPSAGTFRLYLDFQHDGAVHTAEFTVVAGAAGPAGPAGTDDGDADGDADGDGASTHDDAGTSGDHQH